MTIGAFRVRWSKHGHADWRALSLDKAKRVSEAVERFATTGNGTVIATTPTEFLLFVDDLAVMLIIEGDDLHVDGIRRA
jgi:hypothetical protein